MQTNEQPKSLRWLSFFTTISIVNAAIPFPHPCGKWTLTFRLGVMVIAALGLCVTFGLWVGSSLDARRQRSSGA